METYKIFVLLTAVLLAAGCTGILGGKQEQAGFRTGSQGITMKFAANAPPTKMYDDEPLNVIVEAENRGATKIQGSNNRIYISGFDPTIITGVSVRGEQIPIMDGKSQYNPNGDYSTVSFTANVRDLKARNIDTYDPTLLVTSCYRYETIADPMVCIDPDPFATTAAQKVCTPTAVSAGTQAAPVAVSTVGVEPSKGRTRFEISVNNVGGGTVIKDGLEYLNKCSPYSTPGLQYTDVDYVRVEEVTLGQRSIKDSCKPLEYGNLRIKPGTSRTKGGGTGVMYCEVTGLSGPAYKTPLRIKLVYNYRSSMTKKVQILRTD